VHGETEQQVAGRQAGWLAGSRSRFRQDVDVYLDVSDLGRAAELAAASDEGGAEEGRGTVHGAWQTRTATELFVCARRGATINGMKRPGLPFSQLGQRHA